VTENELEKVPFVNIVEGDREGILVERDIGILGMAIAVVDILDWANSFEALYLVSTVDRTLEEGQRLLLGVQLAVPSCWILSFHFQSLDVGLCSLGVFHGGFPLRSLVADYYTSLHSLAPPFLAVAVEDHRSSSEKSSFKTGCNDLLQNFEFP
jgi:hypothetical protein